MAFDSRYPEIHQPTQDHIANGSPDSSIHFGGLDEKTPVAEADLPASSRVAAQRDDSPGPPPDGGFHAWLQVAGSFFLFFNNWGLVNTFGVFQTYYESNPLWTQTPSNISWVGSIQAFLLLLVGVITGPLFDAGYFRHLVCAGTFLITFGFMMTSLCQQYWQVMLAQGFLIGIGNGCLFVPSVAILPQYFDRKKALVNGIATSGSSVGGVIYPIVLHRLVGSIGFPWATRVLGFLALAGLTFSILVMEPRVIPKSKRSLTQLSAFKEGLYTFFTAAMFFAFMGLYGPIVYIQTFAIAEDITNDNLAFYLLPILNAGSVAGRIVPNFITDLTGPLNVLFPAALITGVLAFVWAAVSNLGGAVVFSLLYGFFSGILISLSSAVLPFSTPDMKYLGTRTGQTFFVGAFGLLVGTPVSGAIYAQTNSFLGVQLFSGCAIMLAAALLLCARWSSVGMKLRTKV